MLPRHERRLLWRAWRLLPRLHLRIRGGGVASARGWLARVCAPGQAKNEPPAHSTGLDGLDEARAIARLVAIASRYSMPRPRCLEKSLLLEALLQQRGIACALRFGVQDVAGSGAGPGADPGAGPCAGLGAGPGAGSFEAHAWVEVHGLPVGDPGDSAPGLTALA